MKRARIRAPRVLAAAAALLAACSGGAKEPVVLGVAGPLDKPTGASMKKAVEMAVEEINRDPQKWTGGRPIELKLGDDQGDPKEAIRVATEMRKTTPVLAVIGHVNSGATIEAAPVYNTPRGEMSGDTALAGTDPLVEISPASSSADVSTAGDWTFRVAPTDLEHAPVLAQQARALGRSRAVVMYSNDDYGRGLKDVFTDQFRRGGGTVIEADPYLPAAAKATGGLEPYMARALRQNPDVLMIAGPEDGALAIIETARRLGFTGPIMGGDGLTSLKSAGPVVEGIFVSSAYLPDSREERSREFVQRYRQKYNELPDHRGAMAYDLVYLLAQAIRDGGATREAVREYLAKMGEGQAYDGVSGRMWFDANGDVKGKAVVVGVVRGGELRTVQR